MEKTTEDIILDHQIEAIEYADEADVAEADGDLDEARALHLKAAESFLVAFSHAGCLDPAERGRMWLDAIDELACAEEGNRAWSMIQVALSREMFTPEIRRELLDVRNELPPLA